MVSIRRKRLLNHHAADRGSGGYSPTDTIRVVEVDDYEESDEFYCDEPKTEVIDGVVYAMRTGSFRHGKLIGNISRLIGDKLRGKPCSVFAGTLEYHYRFDADDETRERYFLQPDVMICCDPNCLIGSGYYAAPKFIAKVLSPVLQIATRKRSLAYTKNKKQGYSPTTGYPSCLNGAPMQILSAYPL